MRDTKFLISILLLLAALLAWAVVFFVAWEVQAMQSTRAALIESVEQTSARQTAAARTHAALQETIKERSELVRRSQVDVLSVVSAIESVGKTAGVSLRVSGAQPGAPIISKSGAPTLRPVNFSVQVDGSFAKVMQTIGLLEQLPFPTDMTSLEITRTAVDEKSAIVSWKAILSIKLLTTLDVSS